MLTPEWITPANSQPDDNYGFVYLITRIDTGRMYVGRKYLTAASPKKKGVKRPARKASDWLTYWGSCLPLKAEIAEHGHGMFKREIIRWCATRADTNYAEVEEQFKRDVLKATLPDGTRAYYNGNIASRFFAPKAKHTDETRAKMSQSRTGKRATTETRQRIAASKTGKPRSQTEREAIAKGHLGIRPSEDSKRKMAESKLRNPSTKTVTGVQGVSASGKRFVAKLCKVNLGSYTTIEEAAVAREQAELLRSQGLPFGIPKKS